VVEKTIGKVQKREQIASATTASTWRYFNNSYGTQQHLQNGLVGLVVILNSLKGA